MAISLQFAASGMRHAQSDIYGKLMLRRTRLRGREGHMANGIRTLNSDNLTGSRGAGRKRRGREKFQGGPTSMSS